MDASPAPASKRRISLLALVLILAIAAYLNFTAVSRTIVDAPFRADAREYFFSGYNLVNFGVYSRQVTWPPSEHREAPPPDALRSPGFPLLLASLGPEPSEDFLLRLTRIQALLATITVGFAFFAASRFLTPGWSHLSALLTALSPHLVVMTTYVLSETLFTFLLFGAICVAIEASRRKSAAGMFGAGLVLGTACLTRATPQYLPVLLSLAAFVVPRLRPWRPAMLALLAGTVILVLPWELRKASLPARALEPSLAVNYLVHGSYPGFMLDGRRETLGDPYRYDAAAQGVDSIPKALHFIAAKFAGAPVTYASWYLVGKPGFFLSWTNIDGPGDIYVYSVSASPFLEDRMFDRIWWLMHLLHPWLMVLGCVGSVIVWLPIDDRLTGAQELLAARVVSIVILYAIAFHMIGAPFPRYGVPFRPLEYPLALLVVLWGWRAARAQSVQFAITD